MKENYKTSERIKTRKKLLEDEAVMLTARLVRIQAKRDSIEKKLKDLNVSGGSVNRVTREV